MLQWRLSFISVPAGVFPGWFFFFVLFHFFSLSPLTCL